MAGLRAAIGVALILINDERQKMMHWSSGERFFMDGIEANPFFSMGRRSARL